MQKIPNVHNLKNILVLRGEGSLGDAIISSCCYREIKKANPNIKITVVCFGSSVQYLKSNPHIDEIYVLPIRRVLRPNQYWFRLIWHAFILRKRQFDLVLDSSEKPYANWTFFKYIVGGNRVLDCYTSPMPLGKVPGRRNEHEQVILKQLGIKNPSRAYDLYFSQQHRSLRDAFIKAYAPKGYILFNPFGSVKARVLSKHSFARMAPDLYRRFGLPVVIPCMPSKQAQVEEYLEIVGKDSPHFLMYTTPEVFDLFALVESAFLVVSPDTSVVYIASGFSKKAILFYNNYSIYHDPDNPFASIIKTQPASVNLFDYQNFLHVLDNFS